jgi:peptidoglycan/LPS O-acetylase OafA/YrhL
MAAIMVIFFHLQHLDLLKGNEFIAKSDIFVDFFFVLSGFVMTHSNYGKITNWASIKPFAIKRFKRLYPLHLFTLLLTLLFELFRLGVDRYITPLSNQVFAENKNLPSFLANLTLTQSLGLFDHVTWNGPSWSISVEYYTYIAWAVCLVVFRKNLWLMCSIGFSLLAWFIIRHNGSIVYTYDYGFVRCLYSFLIGMLTYRARGVLSSWVPQRWASFLEILLFGLTLVAVQSFTHSTSWLMPLLFALVILIFSGENGVLSRFLARDQLSFLGELSYSYYLNHTLILNVMDLFLFKIAKIPHSAMGELTYILVCLSCIHFLSVFTYRHIELVLSSVKHPKIFSSKIAGAY